MRSKATKSMASSASTKLSSLTVWSRTEIPCLLVLSGSLLFMVLNVCVVHCLRLQQHVLRSYIAVRKHRLELPYVIAGAALLPVYAVAVSLVWRQQAKNVGCSSIADDADSTLRLGTFGLLVVAGAFFLLATKENVMSWSRLAMCFCMWNVCLGAMQAGFSAFDQTYWAVLWDLRRWHSSNIPVWVGEFGAVVGDTSEAWG